MSFKAKINFALGGLLLALVLMAVLFYGSANRYQEHLEHSELAHQVVDDYRTLSDQSYRKLAAMAQAVATGSVHDRAARANNLYQLEEALARLSNDLRAESEVLARQTDAAFLLNSKKRAANFAEIESISTELLRRSRYVLSLISDGNREQAALQLQGLRDYLQDSEFDERIVEALSEEQRLDKLSHLAADRLRRWVTLIMPLVVVAITACGFALAVMLSRGLNRSVSELLLGAEALKEGRLNHRIAALPEAEFRELSYAFNGMANELERRRDEAAEEKQRIERKVVARTQELRASNAELERSTHSRRQLLANIGHELRTPLTIISGEAQLALRQLNKPDAGPQQFRQPLEQVLEQTGHTAALVDDLLFIARSEASEPGLEVAGCDFSGLVNSSVRAFRSLAGEQPIRCNEPAPMWLNADAGKLRQVVNILLDNALRYSSGVGDISLSLSASNDHYILVAENEGDVLPADEGDKVFERFYRGGHDGGSAEGSGLGLPVAKAIVKAHGGSMSFESKARGGAIVTVELPTKYLLEEAV